MLVVTSCFYGKFIVMIETPLEKKTNFARSTNSNLPTSNSGATSIPPIEASFM